MLYVASAVGDALGLNVTIKDTEDAEAEFCVSRENLWAELRGRGIQPQLVVGLFKSGRTLLITPVSSVELQVLKLLKDPYFVIRDTLGDGGAKEFGSYGLYNFTERVGHYSTPDTAFSIAKLLLEHCGDMWDSESGNARIETTREYIAVCVENTKFQSTYLRFDIESYEKVNRAYTKYKMLRKGISANQSVMTEIEENS